MAFGAYRRTTINIGDGEGDIDGVEVGTEDSMLSLIASLPGGEEITVFIDAELFPLMRRNMDVIEPA